MNYCRQKNSPDTSHCYAAPTEHTTIMTDRGARSQKRRIKIIKTSGPRNCPVCLAYYRYKRTTMRFKTIFTVTDEPMPSGSALKTSPTIQ